MRMGSRASVPAAARSAAWIGRIAVLLAMALLVGSCSPYADLEVGSPFNVDTVTINPNVGIGFPQ